jgi:hypothetical protein
MFSWWRTGLIVIVAGAAVFLWHGGRAAIGQQPAAENYLNCIPFGSTAQDTVVRSNTRQETLEQALAALQASCTSTGFATTTGQRIQIYRLGGCRYMTDEQKNELRADLADYLMQLGVSNKYETIVLDCNPRWGH